MEPLLRGDLHLHSTASDGTLEPTELVEAASRKHLNLIALTDHESIAGHGEAALEAKRLKLRLIPGVEINTEGKSEVHILLYGVHEGMRDLMSLLQDISRDRKRRTQVFLERLADLEMPLNEEDLALPEGTDCGRAHVARAMVEKGYTQSVDDAFERFLGVGCPVYVDRLRIPSIELIEMASKEGALPVLAHPGIIRDISKADVNSLSNMKAAGLMGLEAWHPQHSQAQCQHFDRLAREMDLLVTGGSDFHKTGDNHGEIGCMMEKWENAQEDLTRFLKHF